MVMKESKDSRRVGLQITYGVEFEVRDKDGNLIHKHAQEAKSFVSNYMAWLLSTLGLKSVNVRDLNGNVVTILNGRLSGGGNVFLNHILAPAGNDMNGIRVGSNNAPVSAGQFNLLGFIPNGSSAGRLQYGESQTDTDITVAGSESSFRATRIFTNASGGDVTVGEAGIVLFHYIEANPNEDVRFLIARDALSTPISVPDGATLTVRYKFRVVS